MMFNMMMLLLIQAVFSLVLPNSTIAQDPLREMVEIDGIVVIDEYEGDQGYYIFYPEALSKEDHIPVVFVHGFGALNPMIYGKWLRHLVEAGHPVIYPRYQQDLFGTAPNDFVQNTAVAVSAALRRIEKDMDITPNAVFLIGHSYGGVIIANLAANWRTLDIPEPRIAFLCQPGSGPFKGGVLDSYTSMDSTLHMAIMVGDRDETVGQEFGKRVYDSAVNTPNRLLLWQYSCTQDSFSVSASHYEPYAIDDAFDNGIQNYTSRKALRQARLDLIDTEGYWKVFDLLVGKVKAQDASRYAPQFLTRCSDLGAWPDGTALCKMDFHCPAVEKETE